MADDIKLGQVLHTDLNEPLDVTNKALHTHTESGENEDLATFLSNFNSEDFASETTLAEILAKIISAPSTEAKQDLIKEVLDSLDGKDYATESTLDTRLANLESQIQQILDDGVKQSGSIGADIFHVIEIETPTDDKEETLIDITNPAIIDRLEWGVRNEENGRLYINIYKEDGTTIRMDHLSEDCTGEVPYFTAKNIKEDLVSKWDILRYDPEASPDPIFHFAYKEKKRFPFGFKISRQNVDGGSYRNSVVIEGREFV